MNKVKTETHFEVPGKQEDSTAPKTDPLSEIRMRIYVQGIPVTGREVSSLLLSTRTLYLSAAPPAPSTPAASKSQLPLTTPAAAPPAAASVPPLDPSATVAPAYSTPSPALLPACHVLVLWYDYLFVHFRMH